jgi:hypothetical protein
MQTLEQGRSVRLKLFITFLCAVCAFQSFLTSGVLGDELQERERKQIRAVRITQPPRLDGRLDDTAWQNAMFVSDFLQKEPVEFGEPTEKSEVAIVYDDYALYVAARMYSNNPRALRRHLDRRDNQGLAEQIIVTFDTYHDRRTAYGFGVNVAGVRFDRYHPEDAEHPRDFSYNPVWKARTALNDSSWTAEIMIPFSQFRFNNAEEQIWGINFNRWVPSRNEDIFWVVVPRDETGWPSWFGDLVGIEGIEPSSRIEILPYVAGDGSFSDQYNRLNPYRDGSDFNSRFGGDLKMGLGSNLTLDATFNPDFGQVEADPAEVNLSAYETFFTERRPFFTEGSQLFETNGPTYFYSRRIGASPHGSVSGDFIDMPQNATILGAAKVSGRMQSGLSVAGLLALTDDEFALVTDTSRYDSDLAAVGPGREREVRVEPRTGYGVVRLQQEFGEERSTAGVIMTAVGRDLASDAPLAGALTEQAYGALADWRLRFERGNYEIVGYFGFSHIHGTEQAILERQLSSTHYFQRPDQDHVEIDSAAAGMTGSTGSLRFRKAGGRHWLWSTGITYESPGLEINDAGILSTADDVEHWIQLQYRENQPGNLFRNYSIGAEISNGWNFGGVRQYTYWGFSGNVQLLNYWSTWLELDGNIRAQSDDLTRGGPLMATPARWEAEGGFSNNFTANPRFELSAGYGQTELDGYDLFFRGVLQARLGDRIGLGMTPWYWHGVNARQYVGSRDSSELTDTYGRAYIFSLIERSEFAVQFRVSYFFTPDLSLEVYAEPFAASGRYYDEGILARARDNALIATGEPPSADDFGYQSFRSNVVLRWEFLPGSTAYLVWQRNLEDDRHTGRLARPTYLFDSFGAGGSEYLALKISYWVPVT